MSGDPGPAGADEDVVVTSGDVTSISDSASGADAVAPGGSAIAASLTADVLNIAFVTGGGDVQFVQIKVADLIPGGGGASGADLVVSAELTSLSGDVISSGGGEATPMGTIAVAANLDRAGDLTLSFSDGNGDVQLIETNVGELLQDGLASDATGAAPPVEPGSTGAGR